MKLNIHILDAVMAVANTVDRAGRNADERWGTNRLQTLVPPEMAARFQRQSRKFSEALQDNDLRQVNRHSDAMLKAFEQMEAAAISAGHQPTPPEQWEFTTPDGLVILVRDRVQAAQVERHGRACQVWSLDEIESVIRAHPEIVKAKTIFPGAELVSMRPVKVRLDELDQDIPF